MQSVVNTMKPLASIHLFSLVIQIELVLDEPFAGIAASLESRAEFAGG